MKAPKFLLYLTSAAIIFTACEKKHSEGETKDTTTVSTTNQTTTNDTVLYKIDTSASIIKWRGKKVTGEHNGTVKVQGEELKLAGNNVLGGTVILAMTSIKDEDLTDQEMNQKLIGHLKSPDFFNVEKFPVATFVITSVDSNVAKGQLTIKDKTEEIAVTFDAKVEGNSVKVVGKTTVDRTRWDIKYRSGKFDAGLGDKLIYDDIELEFDIVGNK